MYLNNSKLSTAKIINIFIIVICFVPAVINVLLLILMTTADDPVFTPVVRLIFNSFFIISLIIEIGIIIWRAVFLHNLTRCRLYNSILEEDHDGIIMYSDMASMTGFTEAKVIKDLMRFVKRNYMVNITLGRTAARVDLLSDDKEFQVVACPSCGAHVNIRKNGGGRCVHCGTFMRLKGEDQNV